MYIALAICDIIIITTVYLTSKYIKKQRQEIIEKQRQKIIKQKKEEIDIQKKEIARFNNISEYLIANKDKIILYNIKRDLAWFKLGILEMEIYLGRETFVKINGIDFGHNTELAKVLTKIYYRDREKLLF